MRTIYVRVHFIDRFTTPLEQMRIVNSKQRNSTKQETAAAHVSLVITTNMLSALGALGFQCKVRPPLGDLSQYFPST